MRIGVLYGKLHCKIDDATERLLGIKIIRAQNRAMNV